MRCARRASLRCIVALGVSALVPFESADPRDVVRAADRFRGFARPYRFVAEVENRGGRDGRGAARPERIGRTVVEVRSNGFRKQLVLVLEPRRGDALLKVGEQVWLRPRQLHRLTRIPLELRVFGGAAISDVAAADVLHGYEASLAVGSCERGTEGAVELVATVGGTRYPRVRYRIDCRSYEPRQIEFMAADGRTLKTVRFEDFAPVLGARIATRMVIDDRVFRDTSVVRMREFAFLADSEPDYTPGYLLSLTPSRD